jgi:DNA mismatch repair protein MLH1
VCERFTTSKLTKFEDLKKISTFGFRGEALASITHVAHVSITSKTDDQRCAYKARYSDGKLTAARPGQSSDPMPCAGTTGTQITVEDLFYNISTRRKAVRSTSEQYQRILEVVSRYAIHFASRNVSFTCKKYRDPSADVHTKATNSTRDNIGAIFGASVAQELLPVEFNGQIAPDCELGFNGFVSNANFNMRKGVCIVFINHRLVDCSALKRAVDDVYSEILPRHTHPFMYLALQLPAHHVDVNVHPTKREVHFLHEEEVVAKVQAAVREKLEGANNSRTFYTQAVLPGMEIADGDGQERADRQDGDGTAADKLRSTHASKESPQTGTPSSSSSSSSSSKQQQQQLQPGDKPKPKPAIAPQKLVRTDATAGSLEKYMMRMPMGEGGSSSSTADDTAAHSSRAAKRARRDQDGNENEGGAGGGGGEEEGVELEEDGPIVVSGVDEEDPRTFRSVCALLEGVTKRQHQGLTVMLKKHTFVGVVDHQMSLIQHGTKLYLVNHRRLSSELLYQQALRNIGRLGTMKVEPMAPVAKTVHSSHFTLSHSTTSHSTIIHSTIIHSTTSHSTIIHSTIIHSTIIHSTTSHSTIIHSTIIHSTIIRSHTLDECTLPFAPSHPRMHPFVNTHTQVLLALELEEKASGWTQDDGPKEELAEDIAELLLDKAELLRDYFSIGISKCTPCTPDGGNGENSGEQPCVYLSSMPAIVEGFRPRIEVRRCD